MPSLKLSPSWARKDGLTGLIQREKDDKPTYSFGVPWFQRNPNQRDRISWQITLRMWFFNMFCTKIALTCPGHGGSLFFSLQKRGSDLWDFIARVSRSSPQRFQIVAGTALLLKRISKNSRCYPHLDIPKIIKPLPKKSEEPAGTNPKMKKETSHRCHSLRQPLLKFTGWARRLDILRRSTTFHDMFFRCSYSSLASS